MAQPKETGLPVSFEKYSPPARVRDGALVKSFTEYKALYNRSINDPDGFWGEMARTHLSWMEPFEKVREEDLPAGEIAWFLGGDTLGQNHAANPPPSSVSTR